MNTQIDQQNTEIEHIRMLLQQKDSQIEQKHQQIIENVADLEATRAEVNSFRQIVTVRIMIYIIDMLG